MFNRLMMTIRSNLNELVSGAEDPEKMLNQVIYDMQVRGSWRRRSRRRSSSPTRGGFTARLSRRSGTPIPGNVKRCWPSGQVTTTWLGPRCDAKGEHAELATLFNEQWQAQKASADRAQVCIERPVGKDRRGEPTAPRPDRAPASGPRAADDRGDAVEHQRRVAAGRARADGGADRPDGGRGRSRLRTSVARSSPPSRPSSVPSRRRTSTTSSPPSSAAWRSRSPNAPAPYTPRRTDTKAHLNNPRGAITPPPPPLAALRDARNTPGMPSVARLARDDADDVLTPRRLLRCALSSTGRCGRRGGRSRRRRR